MRHISSVFVVASIVVATTIGVPLAGVAQTMDIAQYQVLEGQDLISPEGVESIPTVESEAPERFIWTANNSAQGIVMSGNIPNEIIGGMLSLRGGLDPTDLIPSDGAPSGFYRDAVAALDALALLETGSAGFDGSDWFVDGTLLPGMSEEDLLQVLETSETFGISWSVAVQSAPTASSSATTTESEALDPDSIIERIERVETEPDQEPEEVLPSREADQIATKVDEILGEPAAERQDIGEPTDDPASDPIVADAAYEFSGLKTADGTLVFRGAVPDAGVRNMLVNVGGGLAAVESVSVAEGAPQDFTKILFSGIAALEFLRDGRVAYDNGQWLISGTASIDTEKAKALDALDRAGTRDSYRTIIAAPTARSVCESELAAFMADKAISFGSGSTQMTSDSAALLPEIAETLKICPDAEVFVEGHTDSDGGDAANLTLSISRAESVVYALVELGVAPTRLYAVGYGASLPVASNATSAGKMQNRRIVFSLEDTATPIEPGGQ